MFTTIYCTVCVFVCFVNVLFCLCGCLCVYLIIWGQMCSLKSAKLFVSLWDIWNVLICKHSTVYSVQIGLVNTLQKNLRILVLICDTKNQDTLS